MSELSAALREALGDYHAGVTSRLNLASAAAAKELVKRTKATAPVKTGSFKRHIASKLLRKNALGDETHVWYVKAPDHRVTHLLVHGHAGNGHRGDPFLHNALDAIQADYERAVEEAARSD